MIVFDLKCLDGGEVFEGWFSSGADFDEQTERGLLQCPYCGSAKVEKAPMAPLVGRSDGPRSDVKGMMAELAALQTKMLSTSEWVGDKLPEQARAMHLGQNEPLAVHCKATAEETKSLIEEGVPLLPLPLPVVPPGQVN
jgi:hypothetical protein